MGKTPAPEPRLSLALLGGPAPELSPADLSPLDQPDRDQPLSAEEAKRLNAEMPIAAAPIEPARPFVLRAAAVEDRSRALECLSKAIYYEAGFEPAAGQRAVAQVVLNRVRHPAFPKTVCGVVFQGSELETCQFSFTCDGSLAKAPAPAAWRRARQVATQALAGAVEPSVGGATHYHADYVAPYWAPRLMKITQIGAHIFYRWSGSAGERAAFVGRYQGGEPLIVARLDGAAAGAAHNYPPERRADNDVGGRIQVGLGWTPSVPVISSDQSAYARTIAADAGLAKIAEAESPASAGPAT